MSSFPFDAVVFDLDGTLVATERYWPDAARSATLDFFAAEGVDRPVPSAAEWLGMVGLPPSDAFAATFPDLSSDQREGLRQACAEKERTLLARGRAGPLDRVTEVLSELSSLGVRIGVASNCGADYLSAMMDDVGLGRWVEEARCLSSPGIRDKADMIADVLLHFDTRSAVMVGDRRGDRDAAWANGLPHVHIPRGYGGGPPVEAEATLDGIDMLLGALRGRNQGLAAVIQALGGAQKVAVVGLPHAGRALLARDLQRQALAQSLDAAFEVVAEGGDLSGFDRVVAITASEEVLIRRAKGLRRGMAPVEALVEGLPGAHAALAGLDDPLRVDGTNPLQPRLLTVDAASAPHSLRQSGGG